MSGTALAIRQPLRDFTPPAQLPPWRATERDAAIVEAIARFRNLSGEEIATLLGASPRAVRRRLHLLWAHGLLARVEQQHVYLRQFYADGRPSLVYGLTRKGAALNSVRAGRDGDRLRWQFGQTSPAFLSHTIEIAKTMIAFHLATRAHGLRLIDHTDMLPYFPPATRATKTPFRLSVTVRHELKPVTLAVTPDRIFSILANETSRRHNYCLELDRGHMPVARKSLAGTSFARKVLTYFAAHQQKRHTELWGVAGLRVLTITPSEERVANMIEAQRDIVGGNGSNMFLFSTPPRIAASGPLGPAWISGKGETVSLLPATLGRERS